jgi:hypothetical protein
MTCPLLETVRRRWVALADAPVAFTDSAVSVAVSPRSWLCPPGWVGILALGGAAIATVPDDDAAHLVEQAVGGLPTGAVGDLTVMLDRLPVAEVLGPASLAYCDPSSFHPAAGARSVDVIPADDEGPAVLVAAMPPQDVDESGLAEITSPAFVLRTGRAVLAMAGYRTWPNGVAHVGVLTAETERGRGLARIVASAAVTHALHDGLLPQWRARGAASRRVARALGFHELGSQASVRLRPATTPRESAIPRHNEDAT